MSELKVKEAHLLILKHQCEGQTSNVTHTSRSQLEHFVFVHTKTSRYHLHALPLPVSRVPVFHRMELLWVSGGLIFIAVF